MTNVAENLRAVRARIAAACEAAGREADGVALVAVSKRMPSDAIRAAYAAGQRDFGENYVQELVRKRDELADLPEVRFHLIGHLQSNKARLAATLADCIQTVDSVRVVDALGRASEGRARPLQIFIQVNVAGEDSKSGCAPDALARLVAAARTVRHLRLRGLMTVPPAGDPSATRAAFRALAALAAEHELPELSMGMSDDLELAVSEGATLVRVGTAIFGARPTA